MALLLQRTELKVVVLDGGGAWEDGAPHLPLPPDRFLRMGGTLPFDQFDALLSFCAVFVGNDSGPKHLASLRGANVVSIHSSRINWNEWGQEMTGTIISRKLPCAGCAIFHDSEECGKGFACITLITPDEVYAAIAALL